MKVMIAVSGGMDSAVVLGKAIQDGHEVRGVGFRYGSKHNPYENAMAVRLASHYGIPFHMIDLTPIAAELKSNLLVTGGAIPEGHYEAESMKQTVVPGRNLIFTAVLAGMAQSHGCEEVHLGIHAGDHAIYPDCRPTFYRAAADAVMYGTDGAVKLLAPFIHRKKSQIVGLGLELGVPFHLTRTCYKQQPIACGKCGSCQERLEAFVLNDAVDPLDYESRELFLSKS